jgi:type IV secretory pathway protease TraF
VREACPSPPARPTHSPLQKTHPSHAATRTKYTAVLAAARVITGVIAPKPLPEPLTALEAEAERLVALGATRVERHEPAPPMTAGHLVMTDPEGNVFCLD